MSATAAVAPARLTERAPADQIPSEFEAYWRALDTPRVKRQRALARRLLGFDLVPSKARVHDWAHGCYDADPIAESFVDEVYLGRSANAGRQMLDHAIAGGNSPLPAAALAAL